jgi:3-oxoacyl-(acyl-carrier-protein) synthase
MERVFVTGMGLISAIGHDVPSCLQSLKNGQSGIGKARFFTSRYTENIPFAEVSLSNAELKARKGLSGEKGLSRTALLAFTAVEEALSQAGLSSEEIKSFDTGFLTSSTVGGMSNTDELYADANLKGEPSEFVRTYGGGEHTLRVIERLGIRGYSTTINTACSSAANAIMLGSRLIRSGRLKRVIVGGSDALAKYTVNGFNALMILSAQPCRPFDVNRDGLTLGEGAAYLVLEAESVCGHKTRLAEVTGYGNANDAHHPSATSDEAFGPRLAMERALASAKLDPTQIDYINAHGTGTPNNDSTELFAFHSVFGQIPPFNSTKSYTGHTLAVAGAVEAIISILSIHENCIFPGLNCVEPIPDYAVAPVSALEEKKLNHVISNSFGFGGNCTSLILSAV